MFEYAAVPDAGHALRARISTTDESAPAEATSDGGRIEVLDILRGIALLGMFMVHFSYYQPTGADPGRAAHFLERFLGLFIEERFYSIFGMLFGVGFAVQLERAEGRGGRFVGRYLRRLAILAVFGFIAEGVFGYNVLFGYAMWGVPLLLVRRWPLKALVVLLVLCTSARSIYNLSRVAIENARGTLPQYNQERRADLAAFLAARDSLRAAEKSTSWKTIVAARLEYMPKFHRQFSVLPNGDFPLFLLGLIGFRLGLFTRPQSRRRLIAGALIGGAALSACAMFLFPIGGPPPSVPTTEAPVLSAFVLSARMSGFGLFRPQWLAISYIAVVLLLVARNKAWLRRLAPLGWAGRMSLTNYMMQVILVELLFTPHGLGMKVPVLLVIPAAIGLFVAQVFMSRWWLARFRFGPLEWIWRSGTNWKWQPLRVEAPAQLVRLAA